jgi:hypothetical protein
VTLNIKIDEEKSNYAHLAQENSFFPAYLSATNCGITI